ncbi:MAG TPA: DUF3251 domain-containing protein [Candidatus Omnitrophota bacterium]|nr:DUF3251 domain-containing protein [Candidatus Omnitrophota bacterium]HPB68947.1 DUF3251 domain-containing protein [Candidatus Omnitrophota bacterium]HQO58846.1 DUF3251 domain-containing protein [Candidatus Omnitrophota bacterium]HQP11548.1 DUF3251 domain-containing protein [Candidatus Omnitrophota bacterium]
MNRNLRVILFCLGWFTVAVPLAGADEFTDQKISQLEAKVSAMEQYIEDLAPRLNNFSKDLYDTVDQRMRFSSDKVVVLNPISKKFVKIETNGGDFLIAVENMSKIRNGYRLTFRIGNPSVATISNIKLRLLWGKRWDPKNVRPTYEDWRKSLVGAEYTFNGTMAPNAWTQVSVDATPANIRQFDHLECEMTVGAVELMSVQQ